MSDSDAGNDEKTSARAWYEGPLWLLWGFLELIFFQAAIASYKELETRAAILFAGIFLTLLFAAVTILIIRRNRLL